MYRLSLPPVYNCVVYYDNAVGRTAPAASLLPACTSTRPMKYLISRNWWTHSLVVWRVCSHVVTLAVDVWKTSTLEKLSSVQLYSVISSCTSTLHFICSCQLASIAV